MATLHLFGLLRADVDGVESILTDSGLVQVSTVTDRLLLLNDLCAVGHYCVEGGKVSAVMYEYQLNQVKPNGAFKYTNKINPNFFTENFWSCKKASEKNNKTD